MSTDETRFEYDTRMAYPKNLLFDTCGAVLTLMKVRNFHHWHQFPNQTTSSILTIEVLLFNLNGAEDQFVEI